MFSLTVTRGDNVHTDVFVFYTLAEMRRHALAVFKDGADAVTLYAPNGEVLLQRVR